MHDQPHMTAHHTPGPWTVETRHHVHAICCTPYRTGEHPEVCFVEVSATSFPGEPAGDLSAGSITAQQRPAAELAANARLIAAAPALLAMHDAHAYMDIDAIQRQGRLAEVLRGIKEDARAAIRLAGAEPDSHQY